jgi:hypothetical protein
MQDVDIIVPVHNEQAGLERSIRRLHRFLRDAFPRSWKTSRTTAGSSTPSCSCSPSGAASVATIARYAALRTWVFARASSSVRQHDPRLLPSSRRAG